VRRPLAVATFSFFAATAICGLNGCPDFASGECTDRALCASADGAPFDSPSLSDVYDDAPNTLDDGALPDGNCCISVPAGWDGPFAVWAGASAPPNCEGAYAGAPTDYHGGTLSAPAATCAACGCGAPTGETCTSTIQMYTDGACTTKCGAPINVSNGCTAFGPCGVDGDPQSESSTDAVTPGTCAPTGGAPTVPSATWSEAARACPYSGTTSSCGGGTCYAEVSSPFVGPCISQAGSATCPAAFPNQTIVYTGDSDSRGCSACACSASSGGSCNNYIQFWHNTSCSDFITTNGLPPNLSCADTYTSMYVASSVKGGLTVVGGSCTPSGGQPTGSASPSGPVTICCP